MAKRKRRTSPWSDPGTAYALAVVNGEVITGRLVKLAAARHLRDLERWHARPDGAHDPQYRYVPAKAERFERYASLLRYFEGRWAGQPIAFQPWQQFKNYSLFGWQRLSERGEWVRRFNTAYVQVARKQGKSLWTSAVGNYLAFGEGEPGSQVFSVATKLEQARIIHSAAIATIKGSSFVKNGHVKILKFNMHAPETFSRFEPLGSDSETLDGLNPHGALIDEYHEHPDAGLYNVLSTGMGARTQPLLIVVTTAGKKIDSACGRERDYAVKVLDGTHTQEDYFAYIAEIDPADKYDDESVWPKANPSLGVTIEVDRLRADFNRAKEDTSKYGDFLRKRLDVWHEQAESWIPFEKMDAWWKACGGQLDPERLAGRACYGGLDLASKSDLAAWALLFPPAEGEGDRWSLLLRLWCPREGLMDRVRKHRVPYDMWEKRGWLTATEGNRTDYSVIKAAILEDMDRFKIQSAGYDEWNAEMLTQELAAAGLSLFLMKQNFRDLSEATKEFETDITGCRLNHGDNEAFRWQLSNVVLDRDAHDNVKPNKKRAAEKIDGPVAVIMARGRSMRSDGPTRSRYEEEGAEIVSFSL